MPGLVSCWFLPHLDYLSSWPKFQPASLLSTCLADMGVSWPCLSKSQVAAQTGAGCSEPWQTGQCEQDVNNLGSTSDKRTTPETAGMMSLWTF